MSFVENQSLVDKTGTKINPATLDEQQQIEIVANALQELIARLDFLPAVRGIAGDLRVTLLSGTVTTVTTVSTVTTLSNITSIGGFNATPSTVNMQNQTAILSNIQNVANN